VFPDIYAEDAERLPAGGVPRDAIFVFGYYRERRGGVRFYSDRAPEWPSIGGCPVARTDPHAARYTISFAAQLDRAVKAICRATGAERVDLAGFSMGGLVCRAYARWLSLRAPGGGSRVRRLLTVATPNLGINSLEATLVALAHRTSRPHVEHGEAAELNHECAYWGGRSFIDHLNDGFDAFAAPHGIIYATAYGHGFAPLNHAAVRALASLLAQLAGPLVTAFLVHPTPGFDLAREVAEATGDGDGIVRVASAVLDPARFPGVRFNSPFLGLHDDDLEPERSLQGSTFVEAVLRRFLLEGRDGPGGGGGALAVARATFRPVDAGGERTWLAVEVDVAGGEPVAVQVLVRARARAFAALLERGPSTILIDPAGVDGDARVEVRLLGLGAEVEVTPPLDVRFHGLGRAAPALAAPAIGTPAPSATGEIVVPVSASTAGQTPAFSLALAGAPPFASPFAPQSSVTLPPLAPGAHELRLRARSAANAAGIEVEGPRPDSVRLVVDPAGGLSISR
jgi:hypothetical protein